METSTLLKLSEELQEMSKQTKDKLDLISINKNITEKERESINRVSSILSELQVAIENKDINKMNKLLEDANKISI
jgi:hypothetical protein